MKARRLTASSFFLVTFVLGLAPGCRSNCDLVEAELRTREFQLQTLKDELHRLEAYNDALQREVKSLRDGNVVLSPEAAAQVYPLRSIVLGRPTGGLDEDGQPGDEALQVLVEPRDAEGHTLKVPGMLLITALEVLPEGVKRPLSSWQLPPEQLARSWRSGLITTGYSLTLPWKAWPTTEKVRVVARFVLTDGRVFEAEKDVTVRVAPAALRKPAPPEEAPAPTPGPTPVPPPPPPPVPTPTPVPPPFVPPPPRPVDGMPAAQARRPAGAQPAAHWQKQPRVPLSEAVELMRPIPLPQRVEWGR
jgi:hypothetical protein